MTATLEPSPPAVGFRDPVVFRPVVATTILIAAVAALTTAPPAWFSATVVVAVVAVLGIPHGAVDHLVVEAIEGRSSGRWSFVRNYVLAMAGVGLVWLAAPPLALALFLVLSVHHFGQSDLAYLQLPRPNQLAVQWSRGLFLVGLPLVAHLPTVAPIVERLGGGDPASWTWLADRWWLWAALLVAQHIAVGLVAGRTTADPLTLRREALSVAALTALFLTTDPLVGFAVYFGLWHSLAHLLVLADLLGTRPKPVRSVARLAAPLTAVSLVGLGVVAGGIALAGRTDLLVPVVFVFVSMVTVPHMVVVEKLWRRTPRR